MCVSFSKGNLILIILCLVKVKKPLQKPCTNNLAQRRIQKARDWSKCIKLKILQSRRLLQGLITQRAVNKVKLRHFDWPIPVFIRFIEISRIYNNIHEVK